MYVKRIPRELEVTLTEDPCNLVDGLFFIWTPMTRLDVGTKGEWHKMSKKESLEKKENEVMDGDGVVNMKTHEKKIDGVVHMLMGIWL